MIKNLIGLVLIVGICGCKSWNAIQMKPDEDPIQPRLLTLEKSISDYANSTVITNEDELEIFTTEVERNLIDPYGKKFGYITLSSTPLDYSLGTPMGQVAFTSNRVLLSTSIIFLTVPNLFGMPFRVYKLQLDVTVKVLDSNRELIRKYNAVGFSKNSVAYYYGYSFKDAERKTKVEALKNALKKIRPKIESDVKKLNKALKKAGPINE